MSKYIGNIFEYLRIQEIANNIFTRGNISLNIVLIAPYNAKNKIIHYLLECVKLLMKVKPIEAKFRQ